MSANGNAYGVLLKKQSGKGERIKLFPQGKEKDMFTDLVNKIDAAGPDHELRRPWVMFVHGFNQTIEKNIKKARNIEKWRKVNVIVFSWPSQPQPGKTDKVMKVIKSKAISKFVRTNLTAAAIGALTDFIEDYWRTYTLAKMNAESSADDMYNVLSRLLRSEKAGLPKAFAKSLNGFMKTRRKINYYQPQLIVDDFDDVTTPL